jgi:DNA-binding transcriptional regulator YhcF (GntR family)
VDLEKLEKMAKLVLEELGNNYSSINYYPQLEASFKNLVQIANQALPEHKELFSVAYMAADRDRDNLTVSEAKSVISSLLKIIEIEKSTNVKIKSMKIFESAEEKMKQAGLSFQKEDFASTFHCLNTAFELVLKDKLGIPTTITGINTSNIIEVLVKHKVDSYLYFQEVKKRVTEIDNKIKHQGYSPSKIDAINGIKAMEDLISRLRDKELKLADEIKNKICEGL